MFCTNCDKATPIKKRYRVTKNGQHLVVEVCDECGEEQAWESDRITTVRKLKGQTRRINSDSKVSKSNGKQGQ